MNTGIGRKGKAGLVLALAAAGALFGPLAANAFDVVAGSTENSLSLRVFRGTESQGALAVDVVSAPAWVMSLSPASQVVSPSAAGSAMTEVSLSFDVDPSAAVGSQGELTLRIRSLEVSGMDATKTYHLVVATSAEGHQEILTADCCAALMTGTVFVPTQRSILFSVPLLPVPPATTFSPSQIGDDLGSPIFWTLRRWNPATSSLVTVTSMATGRAFFLRDNQGAPTESTLVDVDGAVLTSTLGFQTAQLDSGFQEIATPYLSAVSWGSNVNVTLGATTVPLDSAVTLGWVESAMYTLGADKSWDVTFADDVVPGTLQPWSGGLILPRVDNLVLSYAAAGAAAAAAAPYHWRVELVSTVAAQSLSDKHNRFGLALGAAVQKDKHDAVQPFNPEATYTDLFLDRKSVV